jgi:hypothetical protein
MKDSIVAGDTLDFLVSVPDYPATDGWTLAYVLVPSFTTPVQAPITITAATYLTTDYRVQVGPTTTVTWSAGAYSWFSYVSKAGARITVDTGLVDIAADPASIAAGFDGRTQAEKALADANTALANFQATGGRVKSYSIAGRSMEFDTAADILVLISYWKAQVTREHAQKAVRDGLPDPRRMYVRVGRV